jgi:hypothetical protein
MTMRTALVPLEPERPRNARLWPVGTPDAASTTTMLATPPPPLVTRNPGGEKGRDRVQLRRARLRRVLPCRIGDARRLLPLYDAIGERPERLVKRDLLAIGAVEGPGGVWFLR